MKRYATIGGMKILSAACSDLSLAAKIRAEGADEIVLAVKDHTFTAMKEINVQDIVAFIPQGHAMGLQVSVIMNRLYGQDEIKKAQDIMAYLFSHDIDAVYFADPGMLNGAERMQAEGRMIYEPETLMTSYEDASFWMGQGIRSVVISPLLTEHEILSIAQKIPHTSLIVHGHTLMSVSKRHLLQAYADAAGKKESFAGNTHLSLRENKREGHMPVYENDYGTMIYTDFIQESFEEMPAFMQSGIERFLIEDAYLEENAYLDAIGAYRKILDGQNGEQTGKEYRKRYSNLPLSNGYYGQKTIR